MSTGRLSWAGWAVSTAALLAGCATTPGVELPAGTLVLGEVRHVLTREMVDAGELAPGHRWENLGETLRRRGYADSQIDTGHIVVVRDRIDWNNTVSGIKHDSLKPALLAEGLAVELGGVVVITVGDRPPSVIRQVRSRSLVEGGCYYGEVPVGAAVEALGAISLVGPRGSASLYCAGIEKEGWQRPRTYWHKLPGALTAGPSTPAAPPPIALVEAAPEPAASADGMATLLLFRNRAMAGSVFDLPVWVDGEKAAVLSDGQCEVLLLAPGDHVVTAGTRTDELFGFPKRELKLSVRAEERIVVEYATHQQRIDALGMAALFTPREQWEREAFTFVQRPARPNDSCAIRHAPTVLRGSAPPAAEKRP